jgi:hypothetical protein
MTGSTLFTHPFVLAEADMAGAIFWSVVTLTLLIFGMMGAARLKRKFKQEDANPAPAMGFTLSDLRQMHRAGQLTDAEFEKAKEKVVLAAQKVAERAAPPPGAPVEKDSVDAIRARRMARDAQEGQTPDDPNVV